MTVQGGELIEEEQCAVDAGGGTNETLSVGGLYCDFGPRPQRRHRRDDEAAEQ